MSPIHARYGTCLRTICDRTNQVILAMQRTETVCVCFQEARMKPALSKGKMVCDSPKNKKLHLLCPPCAWHCAKHLTCINMLSPYKNPGSYHTILRFILQMRTLRFREVKLLTQGHPARKCRSRDLKPGLLNSALSSQHKHTHRAFKPQICQVSLPLFSEYSQLFQLLLVTMAW